LPTAARPAHTTGGHRHEGGDALIHQGSDMRKIITTTFVTLDGVMQAPGGPEEDASGGFKYGGWQAHVMDDSLREALNEFLKPPFAMLLGRTTYNIFAGFWPKQDPNNAIAKPFNKATKYVVSHEPFEPDWVNTTVVSGDVPAALRRLKAADGPDMIVWGSGTLVDAINGGIEIEQRRADRAGDGVAEWLKRGRVWTKDSEIQPAVEEGHPHPVRCDVIPVSADRALDHAAKSETPEIVGHLRG